MKTQLLCIAMFICGLQGYSQTKKGSIMLGGALAYNAYTNEHSIQDNGSNPSYKVSYRNVYLNPSIGYFIMDNLVTGISVNFTRNRNVYDYHNYNLPIVRQTYTEKGLGLGIFATKYFMMNTTFGFYAGIMAGKSDSKNKQKMDNIDGSSVTRDYKSSSMYATANAGIAFFPSKHLSLQAGFGNLGWNQSSSSEGNTEDKNSSFNAGINAITLQFGLYYFFGK